MLFKGKNKNSSAEDVVFKESENSFVNKLNDLEVVNLDEHDDADIEQLFKASSFDTSHPDKIIIRDLDLDSRPAWADIAGAELDDEAGFKPKRRVRRRIKKTAVKTGFKLSLPRKKEEEKQDYIPLASELGNNKVDSDFRKQSADWMDKDYRSDCNGLNDSDSGNLSFLDAIKSAAPLQWLAAALAACIFVSSIMTTTVYAKLQCADKRVEAISNLKQFEAAEAEEVAKVVEDVETPISAALAEPDISKVLSLVLSSVEKDLKIKLVDEDDTLVKDIDWSVTVTDNDGGQTEEEDDDRDGIIHMTDVSAGDYTVELNNSSSLNGFTLPSGPQAVSVKAKVEYRVIADIKEEIKTEKEINAAVEDTGNKPADVEQTVASADTVEWLESTKSANGERYEEAQVDINKTAKNTSGNKLVALLNNIKSGFKPSFGSNATVAFPLILTEGGGEPAHNLSYSENNNGTHSVTCSVDGCEEHNKIEDCDTSGADGACSKCGYKAQTTETPSYVYENGEKTETTHTLICKTDNTTKTEAHSFNGNICSVCGYEKQEASVSHNLSYTKVDSTHHNVTCSVSNCSEHTKTNVECTFGADNKCVCGNVKSTETTQTYKLTVTGGSGTGTYKQGDSVSVAAEVPSGQVFSSWSSNGITLSDTQKKSSTITIQMPAGDVSLEAVFAVEESKYSDDAQLYDSSMNPLYVKENDSYRLAKYADYKKDSAQKFFKKVEDFLYTGWQTINGKRYYYNRDNQPVTGDQIIQGVQYHFGTDGALSMGSGKLGIDVSKYQPSINWASVKRSGIDYVIIRCGYRGSDTGVLVEDPYFKSHIKGAKAAGLKVGVYFFTTAVTEAEAVEEASMVAYLCGSYGIDYPVFMDCESSPRAGYNGMSASQRTAIIKAFCNTIRSAGYTPGVYANKTWLTSYINAGELGGYKIWLAQYNSNGPTYGGRYDLWQYTSKGSVDGIPGNVDMNQSYLGY